MKTKAMLKRPTIAELEQMMSEGKCVEIEPDGTVVCGSDPLTALRDRVLSLKESFEFARTKREEAEAQLTALTAEVEGLRGDKDRLDWLQERTAKGFQWAVRESALHRLSDAQKTAGGCYQLIQFTADKSLQPTLRAAIDAARQALNREGTKENE